MNRDAVETELIEVFRPAAQVDATTDVLLGAFRHVEFHRISG